MRVIPAVDLRDGACVQLVGGVFEAERIRLPDPVAVVASWLDRGFPMVHLVDLDAATGRGSNRALLQQIVERFPGVIQAGGGIRDTDRVRNLLAGGAARVVVGTRALTDPAWLSGLARSFPGRIVVAADVRDRAVTTHGWDRTTAQPIGPLIRELTTLPLAGVLVTAVHVEGRMEGPDLELVEHVLAEAAAPVLASGGITTLDDLAALARLGVSGCVIGMALYTGRLDPDTLGLEYRQ